jgi:hypothetical protein
MNGNGYGVRWVCTETPTETVNVYSELSGRLARAVSASLCLAGRIEVPHRQIKSRKAVSESSGSGTRWQSSVVLIESTRLKTRSR